MINDPNSSVGVGAFPDDIIERCIVIRFEPLAPEEMLEYFIEESTVDTINGTQQINQRLLGEAIKNAAGQIQKYSDGTTRYDGLIGLMQELNRRKAADRLAKLLPRNREIGYRVIQDMLKRELFDKYEFYAAKGYSPQEIVYTAFTSALNLEGTDQEKLTWRKNILGVFEELKLWDSQAGKTVGGKKIADAIDTLLHFDGIKVPALEVLRKPKTNDEELNKALTVLQKNPFSSVVIRNIAILEEKITALIINEDKQKMDAIEAWIFNVKEIYQILKLIQAHRFDSLKGPAYSGEDQIRLNEVLRSLIEDVVGNKQWPEELLQEENTDAAMLTQQQIIKETEGLPEQVRQWILRITIAKGNKTFLETAMPQLNAAVSSGIGNNIAQLNLLIIKMENVNPVAFANVIKQIKNRIAELEKASSVVPAQQVSQSSVTSSSEQRGSINNYFGEGNLEKLKDYLALAKIELKNNQIQLAMRSDPTSLGAEFFQRKVAEQKEKIRVYEAEIMDWEARIAQRSDPAQLTKGGIDLNSQNYDLEVRSNGKPIADQITASGLNPEGITGFVPVIISITPAQWPAALMNFKF
ncbi:MAG: hypothetical protein HQL26_00015 [Candidatus Omnitrophica bacterium]|nr:hypothetical protein [Candidatus Omnitrophota bacterium]